MLENTLAPEQAELSVRLDMSPTELRKIQQDVAKALASFLCCNVEVLGIHPARPETHPDYINAAQLRALGQRGLEY